VNNSLSVLQQSIIMKRRRKIELFDNVKALWDSYCSLFKKKKRRRQE